MLPDRLGAIAEGRKALCESLTVSCSLAAQRADRKTVKTILRAVTDRNPDILSAALRRTSGMLYATVGSHQKHWPEETEGSTLTHMHVPIHIDQGPWGRLELCFKEPDEQNWTMLPTSVLHQMVFVVVVSLLGQFLYLRRVLRHLDPSQVIPERVRQTLDSLAEGLLVLDRDERIVLANQAFAENLGQRPDELQGHRASELPWSEKDETANAPQPWAKAIRDGVMETGHVVKLGHEEAAERVFQVNSAPIPGGDGTSRGALATFTDVTALEVRNNQLGETLTRLQQSRDQISEQNEQLRRLATIDPLTQCLNRRAFFEELENQISAAERKGHSISYVIMDVDHFKSVNDNHGHQVGDEVLRQVSQLLQTTVDNSGLVCRYGGEEFSILLPNSSVAHAADLAETVRKRIESTPMADLKVTASFGVVQFALDCSEPLEALDQADKALYVAKRTGRNRIVRWDQIPEATEFRETSRTSETPATTEAKTHIPFTAVSVLVSALECRDSDTAEHSRRVANLCVAIADGLMSEESKYILEVAALLHDIGKLSIPDTILLKPGPLTQEEWKVMDTHLRLGEKTVKNAFASPELVEILRTYRAAYDNISHDSELPNGDDIPLAARILHIADAYDAMVSRRVFRDAMSEEKVFAELRRCAGTQFDPELVERCISLVSLRNERHKGNVDESTERALHIGTQLEKFALAVEGEDFVSLGEMAVRLKAIARDAGIEGIAELAEGLHQSIDDGAPWSETLQLCSELLELCQATQHAYTSSHEQCVGSG